MHEGFRRYLGVFDGGYPESRWPQLQRFLQEVSLAYRRQCLRGHPSRGGPARGYLKLQAPRRSVVLLPLYMGVYDIEGTFLGFFKENLLLGVCFKGSPIFGNRRMRIASSRPPCGRRFKSQRWPWRSSVLSVEKLGPSPQNQQRRWARADETKSPNSRTWP